MKLMKAVITSFLLIITAASSQAQSLPDTSCHMIVLDMHNASMRNYRDLGDILELIPGLANRDLGSTGLISAVRFRGDQTGHTLLLLDGEILNDPWSGISDLSLIPTEMIERIEIYPSINPFGMAPGGTVIQIVSKQFKGRPFSKFFYRSGSNNFSDLDVALHQSINSRLHISSGALIKKYEAVFGEDIPIESYEAHKLRAAVTWQPVKKLHFLYQILYNKADKDLPFPFLIPLKADSFALPHYKLMRYDHRFRVKSSVLGIKTELAVNYTDILHETHSSDFSHRLTKSVSRLAISLQQSTNIDAILFKWGLNSQKRMLEIPDSDTVHDYLHHAFLQSCFPLKFNVFSFAQAAVHTSPDGKTHFLGAAQLLRRFRYFQLTADFTQGIYDPSLGETQAVPYYLSVPTTIDQHAYWHQPYPQTLPNPDLGSEKTRQIQIACITNPFNWLKAELSGYTRNTENVIIWVNTENGMQFQNSGSYDNSGIETAVRVGPFFGFSASIVFNYLYSEDADSQSLPERPNYRGNAALFWVHDFFKKDLRVKCCLSSRYHSETWGLNSFYPAPALAYIDPEMVIDLKLLLVVMKHFQIIYEIDNLLDYESTTIPGFPPAVRSTRFGFRWNLFD